MPRTNSRVPSGLRAIPSTSARNKIERRSSRAAIGMLASLFTVIGLLACSPGSPQAPERDRFSKVLGRGSLHSAYIPYPPSLDLDPNTGKFSGIFYEVLVQLSANLDLELEMTEEVAWGSMIEAVKSERVDLVCSGIWPHSSRAREADFSEPLYYSPIFAYVRSGDLRFDKSLDAVNNGDVVIAAIDGEMTSIIAAEDFPVARTNMLPQISDVSQVLLEVQTGKADITFVEAAVASEYLLANPDSLRRVPTDLPVRVFPNAYLLPKGSYSLKSTIDVAIRELQNTGFINRVLDKYDPHHELFLRRALPYREPAGQRF